MSDLVLEWNFHTSKYFSIVHHDGGLRALHLGSLISWQKISISDLFSFSHLVWELLLLISSVFQDANLLYSRLFVHTLLWKLWSHLSEPVTIKLSPTDQEHYTTLITPVYTFIFSESAVETWQDMGGETDGEWHTTKVPSQPRRLDVMVCTLTCHLSGHPKTTVLISIRRKSSQHFLKTWVVFSWKTPPSVTIAILLQVLAKKIASHQIGKK